MIDFLFPPVCIACGHATVSAARVLCPYCIADGLQAAVPDPNVILPEGIDTRFSAWQFDKEGIIQHLLHALKYGHMPRLGEELGMEAAMRSGFGPAWVVPVPLHPKRLRKRGYNQAEAIGKGVAQAIGGHLVAPDVVIRTRHTRTQTGFSLDQRRGNLKDAFRCDRPDELRSRDIILVDDVFTTGATLFELYDACKAAAPSRVRILTLAQA